MRFVGKVALVTGIASGIGRATGRRLADEGAAVIGFDRAESGSDVVSGLPPRPEARHAFYAGNVSEEKDVSGLFAEIRRRWGTLHVIAHCAGISQRCAVHEMSVGQWHHAIEVNLTGTFLVAREAFRLIEMQEEARSLPSPRSWPWSGIRSSPPIRRRRRESWGLPAPWPWKALRPGFG